MTRHSFTARLAAFFQDHPNEWIPATALEQFGRQAWRTRLSNARLRYHMRIDNRVTLVKRPDGTVYKQSEYRYVPVMQTLLDLSREKAS